MYSGMEWGWSECGVVRVVVVRVWSGNGRVWSLSGCSEVVEWYIHNVEWEWWRGTGVLGGAVHVLTLK